MSLTTPHLPKSERKFPPFNLQQLLKTVFQPQPNERLCILIDLQKVEDVIDFAFLKKKELRITNAKLMKHFIKPFVMASCRISS